jgi:hypothetical protein
VGGMRHGDPTRSRTALPLPLRKRSVTGDGTATCLGSTAAQLSGDFALGTIAEELISRYRCATIAGPPRSGRGLTGDAPSSTTELRRVISCLGPDRASVQVSTDLVAEYQHAGARVRDPGTRDDLSAAGLPVPNGYLLPRFTTSNWQVSPRRRV